MVEENKNKKQSLLTNIYFIIGLSIVVLLIGILGFYIYNEADWITAFYDAAATMSAVGAADEPSKPAAKIFAGFYTLFTGLFYIFLVGIAVALVIGENKDPIL